MSNNWQEQAIRYGILNMMSEYFMILISFTKPYPKFKIFSIFVSFQVIYLFVVLLRMQNILIATFFPW